MKIPAPLQKLGQACRRAPATAFGSLSWRPPDWWRRIGEGWARLENRYPHAIAAGIIAIFLLLCGAAWTWHWYQSLPKPHYVAVKVDPIAVTKLEEKLKFPQLVVHFSESAARLEDLKKPSVSGVRLEPEIGGSWHWATDDTLVFQPSEDWPADQKFQIVFDKKFFPRQIRLARLTYQAHTPPFEIAIKDLQFYQDPTDPKQRQITATLELTHSVASGALDGHLKLATIGGSQIFPVSEPAPHFKLSYGLHHRLVYLRSSSITLPTREDFAKLTLIRGVRTQQGGAETRNDVEDKVLIPSVATMFRIDSIQATITRNQEGDPEQVLILSTTADINTRELGKALEIRLLPKRKVPKQDEQAVTDGDDANSETGSADSPSSEEEKWQSPADVPADVFDHAQKIAFDVIPSDKPLERQHAFRVRVQTAGELYVRVHKGVRAFGDYPLANDYNAVVAVPRFPREICIEGHGGLLALSGERKLSIRSRGLSAVEYEIDRVATSQINHLVSQTEGKFQHPQFEDPYLFNQENISRIATERQGIALENEWKANYSAFDFTEQLRKPADGGSERGLFFLTARGWDPVRKKPITSIADSRFILVTDIGIVTKKNADGTHDVFLVSIKDGKPIAGATVDLLGKNGIPVQTAKSDGDGHCAFASTAKATREKTPVAFVARNGDDISFIPYAREDRVLNFSRFDVEGEENVLPENLDAFVFTERGVYRPGDQIHIGLIVKQRNWQGRLNGLPLETEVIDARGLCVQKKKLTLPETGFTELTYDTANESPTGVYTFNVYLVKNSRRSTLLGSTTANVKEFLPDRMRIETRLSKSAKHGWVSPNGMRAAITLANLYGTPATDRRVTGRLELVPAAFSFPEFRDFVFFDPLADENKERQEQEIDLGEKKTDDAGRTEFNLQLERFADATYAMRFIAEGFEAEGGRSVTGEAEALVSALPYVIGWKTDGDLRYIDMGKPRALDFVAVDPQLNRIAVQNITLNVLAKEYVSVLTKQRNGNYAYESVLKERVTHSEKIAIPATGFHYSLPTQEPGNYVVELRDDQNRRLSKLEFCVAGRGAVSRSLERNAELQVKLDRKQYNSGDEIAVSIVAPYAGSGVITIERDKVYAYQWFQTSAASSVQHIRVPDNFEGSGYVNVTFVRALDSKEIFVSPLSYGVVPFTANMEKRRLKIELDAPAKAKPGEPLRIAYKTDRPARIVVFAVDQGILQVTNYKTPDPLGFYFRKCALRVETSQIVDLIIPEFSLLRSVSAFGGGGDIQRLNPFKRVTDKPVVFWSGILDAGPTAREVVYNVPDFFDGTLKIMAVAVSDDATGSAERNSLIRGPFVITPSVPVLAAPGDEFEAGVTVANNVEGSGANAEVNVRVETNEQLSVLGSSSQRLQIAEGHEQSLVFKFRANEKLGSGEIRFIATIASDNTAGMAAPETVRHATLSIRPPVPYMTDVRGGSFKNSVEVPIKRAMLPEFAKRDAVVSSVPLGLAHGLDAYLKKFPYGCSEQVTSGAFCRLLLADEADFGLKRAEVDKQLEYTFNLLRRRQNDQGAFGYWGPEPGEKISFVSVYVMDFLSEAKTAGFPPPPDMFASGLRNLQKMVTREPSNLSDARTLAYAIYVLTREGVITTNYILNLRDYLDKHQQDKWQGDITGVYLAGALHLLHKDADAERLIANYKIGTAASRECGDFFQPLGEDSQYIAVLAREFPDRLRRISADEFKSILAPIGEGSFDTLSAAYAVRALKVYSHLIAENPPELTITEIHGDKQEMRLAKGARSLERASFSRDASRLRFQSSRKINGPGAFFQVIEAGFDREIPNTALTKGLEVYRELLGKDNKPVTQTHLGEPIHVRLHIRSVGHAYVTNVAIVDLLPGGFEIIDTSLHGGVSSIRGADYVDLREDRAVFFVTAPPEALEVDYQIKSCNRGTFVVPPVFAQSMYDRNIKGRGVGGKITVTE
jgi:alpha-2-macroglobulin